MKNIMKTKQITLVLISLFITCFMINNYAQETWQVYTKDDGLSSNNITKIFKDSKGNLWFNPPSDVFKKGITKFDGKDCINYYDTNGLANVTVFYEDSNGTIWFGGVLTNGLTKIKGTIFERIKVVPTRFIIEGADGKIWFGASKLYSYDGDDVIEYSKKDLGGKKVTALYRDNSGNIWVGTKTGVAVYDGNKWETFSNVSNSPEELIASIVSDSLGNIWIGGEEGVFKYDGKNWQHFTIKDGLLGNETLMIIIDSRNTIYAIAGLLEKDNLLIDINYDIKREFIKNKGLSIFEEGHWKAFTDIDGVPTDLITKSFIFLPSIFIEDKSGNLWFNSKENSIYKFDGSTWKSFNENNGFTGKRFSSVLEDSKGNYWFSTANGIAKYDGKNWSYFNKDTGLPSNRISSIIEDNKGNIWFGTFRGVVKYSSEKF